MIFLGSEVAYGPPWHVTFCILQKEMELQRQIGKKPLLFMLSLCCSLPETMVTRLTGKLQQTKYNLGDLRLTLWEAGRPFWSPREHTALPFLAVRAVPLTSACLPPPGFPLAPHFLSARGLFDSGKVVRV